MNLRIPQAQVGDEITLGILGTECQNDYSVHYGFYRTSVLFILQSHSWGTDISLLAKAFEDIMSTKLACYTTPKEGKLIGGTTMLFMIVVEGELRNPQGFLNSVARKVRKVFAEYRTAVNEADWYGEDNNSIDGTHIDDWMCLNDGTPVAPRPPIR